MNGNLILGIAALATAGLLLLLLLCDWIYGRGYWRGYRVSEERGRQGMSKQTEKAEKKIKEDTLTEVSHIHDHVFQFAYILAEIRIINYRLQRLIDEKL